MPALRKRSSWFVTLPTAALALGFLGLIFMPTAKSIREKRADLRQKLEFIAQTDTLQNVVSQTEKDLNDADGFARQWRRQAAMPGQLSKLFGKILEEARRSGVTTSHFDPQQEVALETLHRTSVHMELSGTFSEVCQLLASLEKLPEIVWVEELKLAKQRETGQAVKCEVKLEVFAGETNKSG